MSKIRLGTSGWSYKHWKGFLYPFSLAQKSWFQYFTTRFDTVELNASFYRLPTSKAVASWNSQTTKEFSFSVKMNRRVTHIKKMHNCQIELENFFSSFNLLKPKIKVVLIQLPPFLNFNVDRLVEFASYLPKHYRYAFEFRNSTWYKSEIFDFLKNHSLSFCIHDMHNLVTPRIVTSDIVYIRFHGYDKHYGGDYPESILKDWAKWIISENKNGKDVFGYFNNDIGGFAVKNCLRLKEMVY